MDGITNTNSQKREGDLCKAIRNGIGQNTYLPIAVTAVVSATTTATTMGATYNDDDDDGR